MWSFEHYGLSPPIRSTAPCISAAEPDEAVEPDAEF